MVDSGHGVSCVPFRSAWDQPGAEPWLCTSSGLCQAFSQGFPELMGNFSWRIVQDALHDNGKSPVTVAAAALSRDKPDGG